MDTPPPQEEVVVPENQIEKSSRKLLCERLDSDEFVNKLKRKFKFDAKMRKKEKSIALEELLGKIKKEQAQAIKGNTTVEFRWRHIEKRKRMDLRELHSEIEEQKKITSEILRNKVKVMDEIRDMLKRQDGEFVEGLRNQEEEINQVCFEMHTRIEALKKRYAEETQKIESVFEKKRKGLLSMYDQVMDREIKNRSELEEKYLFERMKLNEKMEDRSIQKRLDFQEEHAKTKEKMDNRVSQLEENIQMTRYKFQLNSEKLKYYCDYLEDVVVRKDARNKGQKVLLQQLQDQLSTIRARYQFDDAEFKKMNKESRLKIERLGKKYNDLIDKFKKFEKMDKNKYREIWGLNDAKCRRLCDKLRNLDRVISGKILRSKWYPEECPVPDLDASIIDRDTIHLQRRIGGILDDDSPKKKKQGDNESGGKKASKEDAIQSYFESHILRKISASCRFLVENKVRKLLKENPKGLSEEEMNYIKVRSILSTLGVAGDGQMGEIMKFFAQKIEEEEEEDLGMNMKEILDKHVPPQRIVRILNEYVRHVREKDMANVGKMKAQDDEEEDEENEEKKERREIEGFSMEARRKKREQYRKEQIKNYWKSMQNVIVASKAQLWSTLADKIQEHLKDLRKRKELTDHNKMLAKQNHELREILLNYRHQKINEELYFPPKVSL